MTKKNSTSLDKTIIDTLERLGLNIKTARIRRGESQELLAERLGASDATVRSIEKGSPNVSIKYYAQALWVYEMVEHLEEVGAPERDSTGMALEQQLRPQRASRKPNSSTRYDF